MTTIYSHPWEIPFARTAYEWHSGEGSALYSFASTGGVVWSDGHRQDLRAEISKCLGTPKLLPKDRARLTRLRTHVEHARVGHSLYHEGQHPDYSPQIHGGES